MAIAHYLKEIGRGKGGSRALSREQACDLFSQVLDGSVSDLELGAFCIAMRIKGETPEELAGFLDAIHPRMKRFAPSERPLVVLPSYNGARKLPLLTPLLALLLAREGLSVLIHGAKTESSRIFVSEVLSPLAQSTFFAIKMLEDDGPLPERIAPGEVVYAPTAALCPALARLLDVRQVIGLRNPAHSLVKLMNPCSGPAVVVASYTHPEYAESMAALLELVGANAMLLRGTEGEPVADARRMPRMEGFIHGRGALLQEAQRSSEVAAPDLPEAIDPASTANYTASVLAGERPVPESIARQVEHILHLVQSCSTKAPALAPP
ncbi:MAG: DNA-binding protein YbiB [Burkholderiales bacterium]